MVNLKSFISQYLSEILLLTLIAMLYFHVQDIRELINQLASTAGFSDEINQLVAAIHKKLTAIATWCIFLVGVFNIKRKRITPRNQD